MAAASSVVPVERKHDPGDLDSRRSFAQEDHAEDDADRRELGTADRRHADRAAVDGGDERAEGHRVDGSRLPTTATGRAREKDDGGAPEHDRHEHDERAEPADRHGRERLERIGQAVHDEHQAEDAAGEDRPARAARAALASLRARERRPDHRQDDPHDHRGADLLAAGDRHERRDAALEPDERRDDRQGPAPDRHDVEPEAGQLEQPRGRRGGRVRPGVGGSALPSNASASGSVTTVLDARTASVVTAMSTRRLSVTSHRLTTAHATAAPSPRATVIPGMDTDRPWPAAHPPNAAARSSGEIPTCA